MTINLTEGNIYRQLVHLATPLLLANILQQLYNTVDALMIGYFLGTDAFSAVGVAASVMNLLLFLITGFCLGIGVLLARYYGADDCFKLRRILFTATVIGTILTLALSAVFFASAPYLLRWLQTPERLIVYTQQYLRVIFIGMLITFFYQLFSALLTAIGKTAVSLVLLGVSVGTNIALDAVMLRVWGVSGAAVATVVAQLISGIVCVLYLYHGHRQLLFRRRDCVLDRQLIAATLRYGFSSALHQSSLYIGKLLVQGCVNTMGLAAIAGYTATMRIEGFLNAFGTSGAQAISVFLSQNNGAGKQMRVKEGFVKGTKLLIGLAVALSALMFAFATQGLRMFLSESNADAILQGTRYLHMIALFYVLNYIGNAFVGYYRGIGRVSVPVIGTTLHISVRVLLVFVLSASMGLAAVGLASGIGWLCVVCYQLFVFHAERTVKANLHQKGCAHT